jgi:porin
MHALRVSLRRISTPVFLALAGFSTAPLDAQTKAEDQKPAQAQGLLPVPQYSGDWNERLALTGDWNGLRQKWADHGFTVDWSWTQYGQGVDSGGRSQEWEFGGSFEELFHVDLMRMGVLPGALVTMRVESRYGETVNQNSGLIMPVNTQSLFPLTSPPDAGLPIAITELNYTQFLSEEIGVFAGKIQTMDSDPNEFAGGRGRYQFMNWAFVESPVTLQTAPYSTLATGALWLPTDKAKISTTVMNLTDSSTTSGFEDFGDGAVWATEADFQWEGDLPGGMNVGGTYAFDADFTKLGGKLVLTPGVGPSLEKQSSTWCIFWSTWQYLFATGTRPATIDTGDGRPDMEGIGLFSRFGFANMDTNPIDWSFSLGLGGRGLIGGRSDDTYGLGWFYSDLQQPKGFLVNFLEDHTNGLELYYDIALARSVSLTLDTQWVSGALTNVDDAFILGFRLNASL